MKRGVGYLRVSTGEQATEGVSLEVQEARIRAYASVAGIELVALVREEGVSASKPLAHRPQGMQLVRFIAQGKADHVVALRWDRVFRDTIDGLDQVRTWDRAGVALHLVDMGGQTIDTGSAVGRLFITQLAGMAEFERNLIAERTAAALQHKKAQGRAYGPTPYGFDREDSHLVENASERACVARMRELHAQGVSYRGIARHLTGERVPTKRGGRWHARTVAYVLRNTLHAQGAERAAA